VLSTLGFMMSRDRKFEDSSLAAHCDCSADDTWFINDAGRLRRIRRERTSDRGRVDRSQCSVWNYLARGNS
jgi:hypothetical protein